MLAGWLSAFRHCFTAPVWGRVLVLVAGAVLAPGKRTVSQALRVMGLADRPGFGRYHDVLSRARWNGRAVARTLLAQVLDAFLPAGEVVVGVDDTIERRWGPKIKARGIYRDPVRSSRGHFVRASGMRWLSLMVMVPIPWANRRWALPFLTVLAPSQRWSDSTTAGTRPWSIGRVRASCRPSVGCGGRSSSFCWTSWPGRAGATTTAPATCDNRPLSGHLVCSTSFRFQIGPNVVRCGSKLGPDRAIFAPGCDKAATVVAVMWPRGSASSPRKCCAILM